MPLSGLVSLPRIDEDRVAMECSFDRVTIDQRALVRIERLVFVLGRHDLGRLARCPELPRPSTIVAIDQSCVDVSLYGGRQDELAANTPWVSS